MPPAILATVLSADASLRPLGFDPGSNGPVSASLLQLGSVHCVWSDGQIPRPWEQGDAAGVRSAILTVMPDGEAAWQADAAQYDLTPEEASALDGPRCIAMIDYCDFRALVGTAWVELTLTGVVAAADSSAPSDSELVQLVTPLTETLVQTLAAEPAPLPRWQVPAMVLPLPADCTEFLSGAQLEQFAEASPLRIGVNWDGPGTGQLSHALDETGAERCHLNFADSDSGIGSLDYLPGGGWGFDALSAGWQADGSVTADTVAGLRAEDAALIRCGVPEEACSVDIRFGGNWVQLNIGAYAPDRVRYPDGVDIQVARDNIAAFAEAIVANLNSTVG